MERTGDCEFMFMFILHFYCITSYDHDADDMNSNRFNINFEKLATQEHVFHFDFRFDQRETVRNTKFPSWGHEEKSPLPLHYGGSFTMEIRVLSDRYLVMKAIFAIIALLN